jgi:predicted chitinase
MVLAGAVEYIAQLEKERDEYCERATRKAEYVAQLETERDGYRKESERLQRLQGRKEE